MAICYFLGRLLDEMDGKHARKTGNASVVGLLFDHGCDSFIVGFFLIIVAKIL
jgi:phosphatidylglycerophosphate synthase